MLNDGGTTNQLTYFMLTLFTAPKPFTDPHIAMIQRNAIRSWIALEDSCEILLLGDEPGLAEVADELDVQLIPLKERAPSGAPLVDELFRQAKEVVANPTLCYLNADIILLDDFLPSVKEVLKKFQRFLIVGNRWDIAVECEIEFNDLGIKALRDDLAAQGRLHPPAGSDYFVFNEDQFCDIPPFALGRAGWDNWMMYQARQAMIPLIDASSSITAVHQDHDYAHLPRGEPHYRHPESMRNIELAGGRETMFRLRDADWKLTPEGLRKKYFWEWQYPRKLEADLLSRVGAGTLGRIVQMAFHPRQALHYIRMKALGEQERSKVQNKAGKS
jgi:hypothetical protein